MSLLEGWIKHPQSVWLRKALFQVHLWTGIGLGLYVLVISLTGSAVVFNRELFTVLLPKPRIVAVVGERMTRAELRETVQRAYPDYAVTRVFESRNLNEAAEVSVQRNGKRTQELFDPYTGKDLGRAQPLTVRFLGSLSQLHMDLLMGYTGRLINGICGLFVVLLCVTGAVIWWPGIQNWRGALTIRRKTNWKRLNWDLHNAIGFWTLAIVFMWAITGAYLIFPKPFDKGLNFLASLRLRAHANVSQTAITSPAAGISAGPSAGVQQAQAQMLFDDGRFSQAIHSLHVGDFGGWPVKGLWVLLGLTPTLLFVTGAIMWWNRVLSPWLARGTVAEGRSSVADALAERGQTGVRANC